MVEELLGLAGVFAGDAVGAAKDVKGAEGDVFEIADGRGDKVEAGGERATVDLGIIGFRTVDGRTLGGHRRSG